MTDMKRTTGGLLQGQQPTVTKTDFQNLVKYLESRVKDADSRRVLGLQTAKEYATARVPTLQVADTSGEVLDLDKARR